MLKYLKPSTLSLYLRKFSGWGTPLRKARRTYLILRLTKCTVIILLGCLGPFLSRVSMAQPFHGMDCYAGFHSKFPVKRFLRQYPEGLKRPGISLLFGTFGKNTQILEDYVTRFGAERHLIYIYFSNECSRRMGWKLRYEFLPTLSCKDYTFNLEKRLIDRQVRHHAQQIIRMLEPFIQPTTTLVVATGLESSMTDKAHMILANLIREEFNALCQIKRCRLLLSRNPSAPIVTNRAGAELIEIHGRFPNGDVFNMDGWSIKFGDHPDFFQATALNEAKGHFRNANLFGKFAVFGWSATQQGVYGLRNFGVKVPHRKRHFVVTDAAIPEAQTLLRRSSYGLQALASTADD